MTGGFVNEIYAFTLDGAPKEWSHPLVLRIYPEYFDKSMVTRERVAQEVVAAQGMPAPRVLACEEEPLLDGRAFMVMQRMPGRPLMGGAAFPGLIFDLPSIVRLPKRTARLMHELHELDADPLLRAFAGAGIDRRAAGPDVWLDGCEQLISQRDLDWLRPGLEWLQANRPDDPVRPSICHGDLWGANILAERGRVTGILDWNLVTVAAPAFDLGGQLANLEMSPIVGPRIFQLVAMAFGGLLARDLRRAYRTDELPGDLVRYYSVMRAFTEMTFKVYVSAEIRSTGVQRPTPSWRPKQCARYIRRRTGVRIDVRGA